MMKNLQIVFYLVLMFVIVHCDHKNKDNDSDPNNPATRKTLKKNKPNPNNNNPVAGIDQDIPTIDSKELASVQCISGVYKGEIDIRWGAFDFLFDDNYEATVSLAFAENSLLIKVKGDENDVLCTHYDGVIVYNQEGGKILTAEKITSSRFLVGSDEQPANNLAFSLSKHIKINTAEDTCSFDIGSVEYHVIGSFDTHHPGRDDDDSIEGKNLTKHEQSADFNTLLKACGDNFIHTLKT